MPELTCTHLQNLREKYADNRSVLPVLNAAEAVLAEAEKDATQISRATLDVLASVTVFFAEFGDNHTHEVCQFGQQLFKKFDGAVSPRRRGW